MRFEAMTHDELMRAADNDSELASILATKLLEEMIYASELQEKADRVEDLEQESERQADYPDLLAFFHACVETLGEESGAWPCAEAYDQNLLQVVLDAIRNGANVE